MILDMHVHTVASDDSMATDDITHTGGALFHHELYEGLEEGGDARLADCWWWHPGDT